MQKPGDLLKQRSEAVAGMEDLAPARLPPLQSQHPFRPAGGDGPGERRARRSEGLLGLLCVLLVILLAVMDNLSGAGVSFSLFYLLIVALASWSGGRRVGMWVAMLSLAALLIHDIRLPDERASGRVLFWNLGVQAAACLLVVLLVSAARAMKENLERRVNERSVALEHEIGDRRETEEKLGKTMRQFRQLAENISDAFWMRDAAEERMAYVSPAYEKIWGRSCRELYQFPQRWLEAIHPEDRERVAEAMRSRQGAGEYSQEYRIVRPDGTLRWIRDRAFPIRDSSGKVTRIVGIAEDITDRRRLEREILEISDREQARIGQDLHDGLCQKLISIAFDNNSLAQRLASRASAEASATEQIGVVLDDVITEARAMARGLFPVQLETDGLSLALQQLAASVSARGRISCRFECPQPVFIRDNAMATHLYRIVQEAANNALKHGKPGAILIQLTGDDDRIELKVSDDGIGIAMPPAPGGGMGLHIMDYRARTIGGILAVERGPDGGTVVSCSVRQLPD